MKFLVIDGCPCPADIAPYVYIVLRDAGEQAGAIYRGDDPAARPILHAHGKHTQRELCDATPSQRAAWGVEGTPNPPGHSEHELFDDAGRPLPSWKIGVDSGGDDSASKRRIDHAASSHGWAVHHPYKAGIEGHHWQFLERPRPHSLRMRARILKLRATLPRR